MKRETYTAAEVRKLRAKDRAQIKIEREIGDLWREAALKHRWALESYGLIRLAVFNQGKINATRSA